MTRPQQPVRYAALCLVEPFLSDPVPSREEAVALATRWDELGACAHANGWHPHKTCQVLRNGRGFTIIKETIQ